MIDWSKGRKGDGFKMMFGGVMLIGIAITQGIYGWIGDGTYFRIVYPAICFVVGIFCIWWGYQVVRPRKVDPMNKNATQKRPID